VHYRSCNEYIRVSRLTGAFGQVLVEYRGRGTTETPLFEIRAVICAGTSAHPIAITLIYDCGTVTSFGAKL